MVRKKKRNSISQATKKVSPPAFFLGLTKSQARSLTVGSILVGLLLFFLAAFTWENRDKLQIATVFPTAAISLPPATSVTPTLTQMISATATARINEKQPVVKKLPNTTSKVTYTVEENDNLAEIGKKLCHSEEAWVSIVETNNLSYPYLIYPGETYIITCN